MSTTTAEPQRRLHLPALLCFLLASVAVSVLGGLASAGAGDQYAQLDQPSWSPPSFVFGPVWTILYAAMAVAAWLVWRSQPTLRSPAIIAYLVQLVLNLAWTPLFFGAELRGLAFIDIVLLNVAVVVTIVLFARHSRLAATIMVPYLGWTLFAAALNFSIWSLN